MSARSASPIKIAAYDLVRGMHVRRPEYVKDSETGRRYDPRVDEPTLPDVLVVRYWDWEEGESRLASTDGSVEITYNTVDYPRVFSLVGPHTDDPIFKDANDVGHDMKIQDPDDCQMLAWEYPFRRKDLTEEEQDEAQWVMLTICRPGFEGNDDWIFDVALMQGSVDYLENETADDWDHAKSLIDIYRRRVTGAPGFQEALEEINRHRRSIGQVALDPVSAGWTQDDIISELERIRRLNPRTGNPGKLSAREKLKRRLMR